MSVLWKINGLSVASYQLVNLVLTLRNQQADTLSFVHDGTLFDGDLLFAHGADITLTRDGVVWFKGKIRETPRNGAAGAESISYVAYGAWNILERRAYFQLFAEPVDPSDPGSALTTRPRGRVILGQDGDGNKINLTQAVEEVITFAGLTPEVDLGTVSVPYDEATDYSCADAISRLLQWAPDAVVWFGYDTTPPTCYVQRRAALDAVPIAVEGGMVAGLTLNPRYDLVVDHVALVYIATNRSNSASWDSTTRDVYPEGTTGSEDNALCRTIRLAGSVNDSSYLTQKVEVDPIPTALDEDDLVTPESDAGVFAILKSWWGRKHPWLLKTDYVSVKGFRLGKRVRIPATDDENTSPTPTANLRELVSGGLTDWMQEENESLVTEQQTVSIEVAYDLIDAVDTSKKQRLRQKLEASIVATNAQTKTYSVLESASGTDPEEVPAGLAQLLYGALHTLHWAGQIQLQQRECSLVASVGNVVNLTGSRSEWTSMNALVQGVTFDLDRGQTSIQVGPPKQLGVDSLVEVYKSNRNRQPVTSNYSRATGSSAAQRKQSLPTWQAIKAAQSGTPVAARTYSQAITITGQVPNPDGSEFKTALEACYTTAGDTPIAGDTIALTVGGTEKFRARVSSTGTASGIFTVSFQTGPGTPTPTYYAQIAQAGIYP